MICIAVTEYNIMSLIVQLINYYRLELHDNVSVVVSQQRVENINQRFDGLSLISDLFWTAPQLVLNWHQTGPKLILDMYWTGIWTVWYWYRSGPELILYWYRTGQNWDLTGPELVPDISWTGLGDVFVTQQLILVVKCERNNI